MKMGGGGFEGGYTPYGDRRSLRVVIADRIALCDSLHARLVTSRATRIGARRAAIKFLEAFTGLFSATKKEVMKSRTAKNDKKRFGAVFESVKTILQTRKAYPGQLLNVYWDWRDCVVDSGIGEIGSDELALGDEFSER